MKGLMTFLFLGIVLALLMGCQFQAEKVVSTQENTAASSEQPLSQEEADVADSIDDLDELEQMDKELDEDLGFDELEKMDLK